MHFGQDTVIDSANNIKNQKPKIETQIVNNTFKISNQNVKCDIIDSVADAARVTGTVENISPNLKKNIVLVLDLQDRNGVNIKTEKITKQKKKKYLHLLQIKLTTLMLMLGLKKLNLTKSKQYQHNKL